MCGGRSPRLIYYRLSSGGHFDDGAGVTAKLLELLVGDADPLVEQPELLASALPSCELQIMAGDHVSVLANPQFAPAIARFCAED